MYYIQKQKLTSILVMTLGLIAVSVVVPAIANADQYTYNYTYSNGYKCTGPAYTIPNPYNDSNDGGTQSNELNAAQANAQDLFAVIPYTDQPTNYCVSINVGASGPPWNSSATLVSGSGIQTTSAPGINQAVTYNGSTYTYSTGYKCSGSTFTIPNPYNDSNDGGTQSNELNAAKANAQALLKLVPSSEQNYCVSINVGASGPPWNSSATLVSGSGIQTNSGPGINGVMQATQNSGTIQVSSNIPGASWTITGPVILTGSGSTKSYSSEPTGLYTITWNPVSGYATPAQQQLTLTSGATLPFSGAYVQVTVNFSNSPNNNNGTGGGATQL